MLDTKSIISQHELIYETPPRVWQDGFPIGNGHLGALVYQPCEGGVEFSITKLDVWDRRTVAYPPKVPWNTIANLLGDKNALLKELASEIPDKNIIPPGPRPCGKLKIDFDDWCLPLASTVFCQNQRLSLHDATITAEYELSSKASKIESFVSPTENVIVIKVSDTWTHGKLKSEIYQFCYKQRISLSREIDLSLGQPKVGHSGNIFWIQYIFPDGFEYVMAFTIAGVDITEPRIYPNSVEIDAILDYTKKQKQEYSIYVGVCTSLDSKQPLETVCTLLKTKSQESYQDHKTEHRTWWHTFWEKSGVELENKFLESIWYFSLYQFASTSRGTIAPGLFGLWYAHNRPPWCGDYHGDINMAMTYWPIFSSNHLELGEPFFKTFERLLPIAKKQTHELYNIDGVKYPIATLDTGFELCTYYYRLIQCSTAFYALIFWNWYLFTLDKDILEKHIFPILEEGSKFYVALTSETPNGLLIGPSWAPEQDPFPAYNVNNDLGLIKPLWQAYVKACEVLGVNSDVKTQVEQYLKVFPEYPEKDGEFLDSISCDDFTKLCHPGLLAMVAPGQDVDAESSLAEVAKKTLHSYLDRTHRKSFSDRTSSACDLTWPWLCCVGLKLQDVNYVDHLLMDIGISEFLKSNGFFAWIGGGNFKSIEEKRQAFDRDDVDGALHAFFSLSSNYRNRALTATMVELNSCYIQIINEMMLQSHHGTIRIFPAVLPSVGKKCAFKNLRAEGAFLVSAQRDGSKTAQISIKSLVGAKCCVKIYDIEDTEEFLLKDSDENIIRAVRLSANCWQFETKTNMTYTWPISPMAIHSQERIIKSEVKSWLDKRGNRIYYGKKSGSNEL